MRSLYAIMLVLLATASHAQDREHIGTGRLFTNDQFGDGQDRWRTGSYTYSHVRSLGPYTGEEAFGELIEFRFRSDIITPSNDSAAPGDRPYVGALSLGAHTHFKSDDVNFSLGLDAVAIGPQTGLSQFQENVHDLAGLPPPAFVDQQLPDQILIRGTAEMTEILRGGDTFSIRPFIEANSGDESILRVGADVLIGKPGQTDLLLRESTTGQLYRATDDGDLGFSLTFGGDIARVFDSALFPAASGATAIEQRRRFRVGGHWQMKPSMSMFYGATYLSPEFVGQDEGQVVGSLKLNFNF